ncbi:MAG TPA: amidase [Bryobacteraceae bacterium]|jgi:aspartyl-tRNA(Asn)/glutamyl-tRNA(Gln) amidotransferase subunit A
MEPNGLISRRSLLSAGIGLAAMRPAFADTADLTGLTLRQASELLRKKGASPVDLTQACLARIAKYNPALNAFITVTGEQALDTARTMEAEQKKGSWRGPLHGIPIALKDNMDTAGVRTTGASELFKDRIPSEDAEVVRRLKNAGAIVLGKLNMHELAYGGSSAVSYFGAVHNPWDLKRTPGGSSGGSAAAMASDLCFGSLGTDTAGSVRIPASYCGVVGLKPTYGRVSIRGVIPLSTSLDHVGPLCKTVEDAALMLAVIAGYDEADPTTVNVPVPDYMRAMSTGTTKLRLGIPRTPFYNRLDPEVDKAMADAIEVLRKLTASVADVQLPTAVNPGQIWDAEIYAYHAKWIKETPELYQPQTRAAIQRSGQETAEVYANARWKMELQRREIVKSFANVDLLITATMPGPAPATAAVPSSNTAPFDVFGLPTISVPCGFSKEGLPIGLQISGAPFAEMTVLALAHAYEQATDWHKRRPPLAA